jgi:hypothetical protein
VSPPGHHQELATLTHIIIDEIHERDRFADFMLIILKDVLPQHPHLRLVLMSATLNEHIFAEYFNGCPVIHVPGFMHPVRLPPALPPPLLLPLSHCVRFASMVGAGRQFASSAPKDCQSPHLSLPSHSSHHHAPPPPPRWRSTTWRTCWGC